jgi:PD-(D/E)XK nuclease superfamily protein
VTRLQDSGPRTVKLAPSDLTFLWSECRRCYWLKAKGVLRRPSTPFPKMFSKLDQLSKDFFFGMPTDEMAEGLPKGRVALHDRLVRSRPLQVPGHATQVVFEGRIDTALAFADGTFGILDFKTSAPRAEHIPFYSRQLAAYTLAAENPAEGKLHLSPVSCLGLLCIEPTAMVGLGDRVAYRSDVHFLEIPRGDDVFMAFVSQVLYLLERPEPPDATPGCSFCSYLSDGCLVALTEYYGPLGLGDE